MANEVAIFKRTDMDAVTKRVQQFVNSGELHLPANYSPENAMKAAWLILQETVDRDKRPALQVCTKESIANALLDMAVQGLNPNKKQGYFIVYGKKLLFQRSYFGTMAVCKQVANAKDVWAQVVWEGDEFEYEIKGSRKIVTKHKQSLDNVGKKIVAAYCTIEFNDGSEYTDIMKWEQIEKAWKKSKMNPEKEGSTHKEYPEDMARKTVVNRTCKMYINSSNDSNLFMDSFNRADEELTEYDVQQEIEENANSEFIDITDNVTVTDAPTIEPGLGPDF